MAKKKQKNPVAAENLSGCSAATESADQINRLMESLETYTKHRVECWCCGKSDSTKDTTEARYARHLYESGWRYVSSEKFKTMGVLCPDCAKTPDAERGE